ncbi:LAME_0H05710g1_1 [Lachancea meyersii CBS 8951]|uniref:phosphatidylinositol-3,4,5-trisphosphate 3-phosphatase n=1 Tax=Lachancea meyersii CBS 8951 TaxID=1266667 RepID=A0A1G4KED9_9SACH|nr:LAME_0H05710g1_1 [Lachancea meyersii CBS 8951]
MPLSFPNWTPESVIRTIYSSPINVHKNDLGLTLELSYITQQLIVCSYPVVKYPKLLYRNSLSDLVSYLTLYHGPGNWKIYNFKVEQGSADYSDENLASVLSQQSSPVGGSDGCSFASSSHGSWSISSPRGQSAVSSPDLPAELSNFIQRYGWLDHSPPPFLLLQQILDDMHEYLSQDPNRVALMHCKMGKGRSGSVVIAYLMKFMNCSLRESRDIFMNNRFRAGIIRGVTIRSQLRYLAYHELFLHIGRPLERPEILTEIARSRFKVTEVIIMNPFPHLNLDFKNCCIIVKMHVYNRSRNGLFEVLEAECNDLLFDGRLHKRTTSISVDTCVLKSDVRFSFGLRFKNNEFIDNITQKTSLSHCWLNLYWETLICSRNESLTSYTLEELRSEQGRCRDGKSFALFTIKWDDLDGAKGMLGKGVKLFESVTLRWQLL